MKTRSFISLICSLTINGINSLNQPALAQSLPPTLHVFETLASASNNHSEIDNFGVVQKAEKYGYGDADRNEANQALFDNADESFDNLAVGRINHK